MRIAWRIGKIRGIQINIDPSWLIIFALVTFSLGGAYFPHQYPDWPRWLHWFTGLATSILLFASVLAHELAHSLVALKQGEKVRSITLFIFGGVAQIAEEPASPRREFLMAIAGPLTSLGIALFFFVVWLGSRNFSEPTAALARHLSLINTVLAIFNLAPGFPLDGGRVLRSIIWATTKNLRRATRLASLAGQVIAFLLIGFGVWQIFRGPMLNGFWFVFIGWFLHSAAVRGYRQVVVREMLGDLRAEDLMTRDFVAVSGDLSLATLVDEYILKRRAHAFLVIDSGQLRGIVCLGDVKDVPRDRWQSTSVKEIMTPEEQLDSVSPHDDGNVVLARLNAKNVREIPVVEDKQVKGVVCRSDLTRTLQLRTELGI